MYNNRFLYTIVRKLRDGGSLYAQVPSGRKVSHESLRAAVRLAFGNLASTTYVSVSSEEAEWDNVSYVVYAGGRVRRLQR